ncbi:unnamed protein product [Onchocerca ochengi]|nr:unnamed protein product [Onchocerca ochengi]
MMVRSNSALSSFFVVVVVVVVVAVSVAATVAEAKGIQQQVTALHTAIDMHTYLHTYRLYTCIPASSRLCYVHCDGDADLIECDTMMTLGMKHLCVIKQHDSNIESLLSCKFLRSSFERLLRKIL